MKPVYSSGKLGQERQFSGKNVREFFKWGAGRFETYLLLCYT